MPDRAEIEAVAEVLEGATSLFPNPPHAARYYAEKAIEELDRVRDARGDNEKQWTCDACEDTGIDRREGIPCGCGARPPQGEDHEAARRAITDATRALNAELPGEAWLALKAAMRHLEADETNDT